MLTLASLIIGAIITLGLTRAHSSWNFSAEKCQYWSSSNLVTLNNQIPSVDACATAQIGYPLKYLHSQTSVSTNDNGRLVVTTSPWIEFKPATADWLIWSVVSAVGIGLLVYLLERAGFTTGFADKKRRR